MLVGYSDQDMQKWTTDMHIYEKQKRTKKPFGRNYILNPSIIKSQQIRQAQRQFNPVLQTYTKQHKQLQNQSMQVKNREKQLDFYYKATGKHNMRDFDIITLHGSKKQEKNDKGKVRSPIRNIYNPINNQPIPEFYYQNRELRLSPEREFKNIKPQPRDFNIVTGQYHQDHQIKHIKDIETKDNKIYQKYKNTHKDYNPVFGRYYDPDKQQEYEKKLQESQLEQTLGQKFNKRFPPTYMKREPLDLDRSKPLSKSLMDIDEKNRNAKKRFQLKYLIEREYQHRNLEAEEKRQQMAKNRVHNSYHADKARDFQIVQLLQMRDMLAQEANSQINRYRTNQKRHKNFYLNPQSPYLNHQNTVPVALSQINSSQASQRSKRSSIKSGGFT